MDGNILDSSANERVSEFQDFAEPHVIKTWPKIVEETYRRPGVGVPGIFSIHAHFVEL